MTEHLARLLVVDDNPDGRELLARRLERSGYSVETAYDGLDAIDKIRNERFDLIVLDIMMPNLSGIEVLQEIRGRHSKIELPVLMATAKSDSEEVVRALELGANDYVVKPLDYPIVKARIESQLQMRSELNSMRPNTATFLDDGTTEPGTIIDGRYKVLSTVGKGGFAVVFKARQLSTGQIVALKVMRPQRIADLGTADVELARFNREMEMIGRLKHPHIVQLIDSGSLEVHTLCPSATSQVFARMSSEAPAKDETSPVERKPSQPGKRQVPYIAMEFLDGHPLSEIIADEAPMPADSAVEIMLPVVSAIDTAHSAGIVHRDLKPPNIIVTHRHGRPHPKVLDFGIAKLIDEGVTQLTVDSQFLGTPEYMSPEQARGAEEVDGRADQYTIGVLLYEATTGRRPFTSDSFVKLLHKISRGECERPSQVMPGISPEFEAVVMRAMDPDPNRRFSSMEALGRALLPFADSEVDVRWRPEFTVPTDPPVSERPRPTPARTDVPSDVPTQWGSARPSQRAPLGKNAVWWGLAGLLLAFIGGAALSWALLRMQYAPRGTQGAEAPSADVRAASQP